MTNGALFSVVGMVYPAFAIVFGEYPKARVFMLINMANPYSNCYYWVSNQRPK